MTSPLDSAERHPCGAVTAARTYSSKTTRVIGPDGQRGIEHDCVEHAYPLDVRCRTGAHDRVQRRRVHWHLVPDESRQQPHSEPQWVLSAWSTEVYRRILSYSTCVAPVTRRFLRHSDRPAGYQVYPTGSSCLQRPVHGDDSLANLVELTTSQCGVLSCSFPI
jgi:hypothetical protein